MYTLNEVQSNYEGDKKVVTEKSEICVTNPDDSKALSGCTDSRQKTGRRNQVHQFKVNSNLVQK